MTLRLPLSLKLLGLFLLNLALVGAGVWHLLRGELTPTGDLPLSAAADRRVQAVVDLIQSEITGRSPLAWDNILEKYSRAHGVDFALYEANGDRLAGPDLAPPSRLRGLISGPADRRGPPGGLDDGPPGRFSENPLDLPPARRESDPAPVHRKHLVTAGEPAVHWLVVRMLPWDDPDRPRPVPVSLVGRLTDLSAGGLIIESSAWLRPLLLSLGATVLLWAPFLLGLTRALRRTTAATRAMAEGRLDTRVDVRRRDEIGGLADAVNHMAGRLEGYVNGQKRFMGDVAHELCAPLARIQMAIGILEQRAGAAERDYVNDVREEVQHMSGLVNELLSFSKAGLRPRDVTLAPVNLAELAARVVRREGGAEAVQVEVDPALSALAEPELLARALGNVVRNALRHAGAGIRVQAARDGGEIRLWVSDAGPGVPPEALPWLFDPFYRVDLSRARETGGTGLGLAIVKTCVEACRGSVTARLAEPTGLVVEMRLTAA